MRAALASPHFPFRQGVGISDSFLHPPHGDQMYESTMLMRVRYHGGGGGGGGGGFVFVVP